jgi:hypothetical protein
VARAEVSARLLSAFIDPSYDLVRSGGHNTTRGARPPHFKEKSMADMVQCSFFFNRVPFLKVGEGEPTRNWHRTQTVRDAFEKPEWACLTYLQQLSTSTGADDQADLVSGEATVSLGQMCADLCMANSSLHRTLDRLTEMGLIELIRRGRSRKQLSVWKIYNHHAVEEAFRTSRCTHFCMQGGARRLYRVQVNSRP